MSYKLVFFVLLLLATQVSFAEAGSGSHGGDGIGSSIEDVNNEIGSSTSWFQIFIEGQGPLIKGAQDDPLSPLNPANVKNDKVREILLKWFGKSDLTNAANAIAGDITLSSIAPQLDPCPSQTDDDHDASTSSQLYSQICISTKLLSRFPKWALDAEIASLLAHEYAHHFGYNEDEAKTIQAYFFNVYGLLFVEHWIGDFYINDIQNFISAQKSPYSSEKILGQMAANLCRDYFVMLGVAVGYGLQPFAAEASLGDVGTNACPSSAKLDANTLWTRLKGIEASAVRAFNK